MANWQELFDAFNSGELDKSKYTVVMDNEPMSISRRAKSL